jgi:ABC-type nitrate/sulfonate/bicarbonate transport system permease component
MRRPDRLGSTAPALVLLAGALGVWEVVDVGAVPVDFFPPPSAWAAALGDVAASGRLMTDLTATLGRLLGGLVIGAAAGWGLGLGLGGLPRLQGPFDGLVALLQPIPKLAVYPLMLLLLGLGEAPRVSLVALAVFFPAYITVVQAVRGVDRDLLDVVATSGGGRRMRLRRVLLPTAAPAMLAGLRIGWNNGLLVTVGLEFLASGDGIGARLWAAWLNLRPDLLFAMLVVLGAIGVLSNGALRAVERRTTRWRRDP